jgi:hypothetical protein
VLRRLVPSTYRPVLANRVFRRLILGFAVSDLGDGMSFVAVAWLAIELAPQATAGLWVGGAVAAYALPGVAGALVFGRRLRRVPARRLLLADNLLRGVVLGAVPLAWLAGLLTPPLYVVLLAVSSPRDRRPARTRHPARPLLDAVRHRRGARRAGRRRAARRCSPHRRSARRSADRSPVTRPIRNREAAVTEPS